MIKVALVLGGGGARGIAHAGVIEVLETNNIPINLMVGTSAGAMVGALYSDQPDYLLLKKTVTEIKQNDVLDVSYFNQIRSWFGLTGPIKGRAYENFLQNTLHAKNIEELSIPLAIVTSDYDNNQPYTLTTGPIIPAIIASSSLPPYFSPATLDGHRLYDGGALEPVPVSIAKTFKPQLIIAVNISRIPDNSQLHNMGDLEENFNSRVFYKLATMQANLADILITPDVSQYSSFDVTRNQAIYDAGKQAAEEQLPLIKQKLLQLEQ
jgi:NTE family protein